MAVECGKSPLTELDKQECMRLLETHNIGRLASSLGNTIDLFAVRYVLSKGKIYFQTKPGDTFSSIVVTRKVAFEIDEHRYGSVKQVTVHGTAHWYPYEVDLPSELLKEARIADPEIMHWVEITPEKISGRELKL